MGNEFWPQCTGSCPVDKPCVIAARMVSCEFLGGQVILSRVRVSLLLWSFIWGRIWDWKRPSSPKTHLEVRHYLCIFVFVCRQVLCVFVCRLNTGSSLYITGYSCAFVFPCRSDSVQSCLCVFVLVEFKFSTFGFTVVSLCFC